MKLVAVHSAAAVASGDVHLALTPDAVQSCIDAGATPTAVDDHADRAALRTEEADYLRWQHRFFRLLEDHQSDAPRSARSIAAHILKTPMDSTVVWSRLLGSVLDHIKPNEVLLQTPGGSGSPAAWRRDLQYLPLLGDRPLAADLLPLLCAERRIAFDVAYSPARTFVRASLGRRERLSEWLRVTYNAIGLPAVKGPTDLMVGLGGQMRRLAARSRREGHRIILGIIDFGGVRFIAGGIPPRTIAHFASRRRPTRTELAPLVDEIVQWSRVQLPDSFIQRLSRYLDDICIRIEDLATALEPFLAAQEVERVFVEKPSWIGDYAILLAAGRLGAQRIQVEHGENLFSQRHVLISELQGFDGWMITDPTVVGHLRRSSAELGVVAPAFLGDSPRVEMLEARRAVGAWDDLPICYVPGLFVGEAVAIDAGYYEDVAYYRWQLRLLDLFATHTDHRFIWKALPSSNAAHDPIESVIKRRGISNVAYETIPFTRIVQRVGRVLTDFASTAAFEAAHAGRPLLALVHEGYASARPEALTAFGASARAVSSWEDAATEIERFLSAPPTDYIVDRERLVVHSSTDGDP